MNPFSPTWREVARCPFCHSSRVKTLEVDGGVWAVFCAACEIFGPRAREEAEAAALWNREGRALE